MAEGIGTVEEAWGFAVLKSETELHDTVDWVKATPDDCNVREVSDTHIHLQIHHFSIWTLIGSVKEYLMSCSKKIKVMAYTPLRDQSPDIFKIVVCCLDDYDGNYTVSSLIYEQ